MKKVYTLIAAVMVAGAGFAQADTTRNNIDTTKSKVDTIRVGNFIIIKKSRDGAGEQTTRISVERKPYTPSKISTNWWIFDLGFANLNDKTDYASAETQNFLTAVGPAGKPTKDDLKLRAVKSSNVNIWVVMQRLSLAKSYVNLKYGIGLEMFNFRYENNISYQKNGATIFKDSIDFSKDKLYAGYISVPFMLNINTSPGRKKGLSLSAGVSAGYLVGSLNKQISPERGKVKTKGDLGLEQFRLAYVGEIGLGPVRLFGSYSIRKLHEKGLEQYPYSLGIRFSNW